MDTRTIVVLEGDQTGQELLEASLRVLQPDVLGFELALPRFDLSLGNRRETANQVVHDAARTVADHGLGLKAATVTPEGRDDVGSPNRILREDIGGKVIVRTGRRIPGVLPVGGVHSPISVVRMAVGDAYGAKEWREGDGEDEVAFRTERIERNLPRRRGVLLPSGRADRRKGLRRAEVHGQPDLRGHAQGGDGRCRGAPSRCAVRAAVDRRDVCPLISSSGAPMVIPALNRDGDILSDLVLPLFGSIAGSESLLVAFGDDGVDLPTALMAEAAHGTAPALEGKDVANPMAMILAAAALLAHADDEHCQQAGRAIREATLEAVAEGIRTADLSGHHGTTAFADEVVRRTRTKLEVWAAL